MFTPPVNKSFSILIDTWIINGLVSFWHCAFAWLHFARTVSDHFLEKFLNFLQFSLQVMFFGENKKEIPGKKNTHDDDDDYDKLFLWYGWLTKDV